MYIKNKRVSSIEICRPFQYSSKLKLFDYEIAFFSYTEYRLI